MTNNKFLQIPPYLFVIITMFLGLTLNSIAIIILFLYSIIFNNKYSRENIWFLIFLTSLFFFNFFHIYNNGFNFKILESKLSYLVFPLIFFFNPILNKQTYELILKFFLISNLTIFLICLFNAIYIQFLSIGNFYDINWFLFSYHDFVRVINIEPIHASVFSGLSVFISFYFFNKNNKRIYIYIILALVLFQVMLTSRMPLVATCIVLIISIFKTYSFKKSMLLMFLTLTLILSLGSLHSITRARFISVFKGVTPGTRLAINWGQESGKFSDRTLKWGSSVNIIKRNLLIGVGGTKMKDSLVEEYKKNNYRVGVKKRFDPHNQYLTETLSNGILSTVVLILLLTLPCLIAFKRGHILYFSFLLLNIFCLTTESLLYRQKGLVFYCFFNALFFSYYFFKKKEETKRL